MRNSCAPKFRGLQAANAMRKSCAPKCPECSETEVRVMEDRVIGCRSGMIGSQRSAGRLPIGRKSLQKLTCSAIVSSDRKNTTPENNLISQKCKSVQFIHSSYNHSSIISIWTLSFPSSGLIPQSAQLQNQRHPFEQIPLYWSVSQTLILCMFCFTAT